MQIHVHQCMAILGIIIYIQSNLDSSNLGTYFEIKGVRIFFPTR